MTMQARPAVSGIVEIRADAKHLRDRDSGAGELLEESGFGREVVGREDATGRLDPEHDRKRALAFDAPALVGLTLEPLYGADVAVNAACG